MTEKSPYQIIKNRHITEKATVLEGLQHSESNVCVQRCKNPKYVFMVHPKATKKEISNAVEKIYEDKNIKVVGVNTIKVPSKPIRKRGRLGRSTVGKKAVVTLAQGDILDDV